MKLFGVKNKKSKSQKARPRKSVVPLWRRPWALPGAILLVVVMLGGGGWWAVKSGQADIWANQAKWRMIALSGRLGFTVQDILVTGRHETEQEDLLKAVRLARGAPILAFDLDAARKRVEALPWVRRAVVQRKLPGTIYLQIEERKPLALWQHNRRFALIDAQGVVITRRHLERFSKLLVVVGEKAPKHAVEIIKVLNSETALLPKVKAAVWVGERRWNIRMAGDIDVRLPEDSPLEAWRRLAEYERKHGVLKRDVTVLDLRQPDRLIVRTKSEPADAADHESVGAPNGTRGRKT
ncbi:MAG: FtsQ-type POTRA domain-containing protein [Rhodospirillales bacterium]